MPPKQKSKSWEELKQAGNNCFKTGQYGDATNLYSQAINALEKSSKKNPEDLGILHSNRAAAYLKDGNCAECVKDCNTSLELFPFNIKSLLRRCRRLRSSGALQARLHRLQDSSADRLQHRGRS
ncbi:Mitochondrial import receptor subunit TOM34 [Larimichthys crocea]|uniref:Uncharacterized protein n=1 Tax=Larimichthys crocea TaxID=215358 RepID=A0ACD3RL98_LARCR|nr:Mitochondrial import receptor subunit TOM34 [Larimichthys crocea]